MIKYATGSDGAKYWRPIYIGFIKNDYLRRTLCVLATPFVFLMASVANAFVLICHVMVILVAGLFRSFWNPLRSLLRFDEIWKAPRHKNSEIFNQVAYDARNRRIKLPDQESCVAAVVEAHARLRDLGWQDAYNAPNDGTPFQAYVSGYVDICEYVTYEGDFPTGRFIRHLDEQYGGDHQKHEIKPLLIRPIPEKERESDPFINAVMAYALHKQAKHTRDQK